MKKVLMMLAIVLALAGCSKKPPMFHVISTDTCRLEGTIGKMAYVLEEDTVADKSLLTPTTIICVQPHSSLDFDKNPIGLGDVGKDFAASVDLAKAAVTVRVPSSQGFRDEKYLIVNMREVQTASNQ